MTGKAWSPDRKERHPKKYQGMPGGLLPPGKERGTSRTHCPECGEPITYDTQDGRLIALEGRSLVHHRHQPERLNTAEANRRRVQGGECSKSYTMNTPPIKGGGRRK